MKLRCKLYGQPLPQVTWYFNEQQLKPGDDDRNTIISDFHEFIVVMSRPSLDMSGTYTAVASNEYGTVRMSTTLTVQGRSRAARRICECNVI